MPSYPIGDGDQKQETRSLACASTGRLWAIYARTNYIVSVAYSDDNGETWTTSDVIDGGAQRLDYYSAIAIDSNDLIHIAYAGATLVHRSRPSDLSSGWSAEHTILNALIDAGGSSSLVIDSNDDLHVLYTDGYNLYYKKSADSGGTWSGATTLYSADYVYYHFMAIDKDDNIHVVFDKNAGQVLYRIYTNAWQAVETVSSAMAILGFPIVAVDSNNTVHVVWFLQGTPDKIYYNKRNGSWGTEQVLSSTEGDFDASVSVDKNDNIYVVWARSNDEIYMRKSTDGGSNWTVATALGLSDLHTYAVPNLIFATHPMGGNQPNVLATDYAFTYNTTSKVNFFKPEEITAWIMKPGHLTWG